MSHGGLGHAASASHGEGHAPGGRLEQIAHHIGLVLTMGYVLLSCIGVVFETLLLRSFHTDFLTYAEPEDFLMAGLRHPVVLGFVVISGAMPAFGVGIMLLGQRFSERFAQWRAQASPLRRMVRIVGPTLLATSYFFFCTQLYSEFEAKAIRAGEEPRVRLEFQQFGAAANTASPEGNIVATTGHYLFFYAAATRQMQVIPVAAIRQIVTPERLTPAKSQPDKSKPAE